MRILIIGNGGRENAICYKLSQSNKVTKLFMMPKNPGINEYATGIDGDIYNAEEVLNKCLEYKIEMVVIGPEIPLCNGLSDYLMSNGLIVFGPNKKAATFEASKAYTKEFLIKHKIPTAKYHRTTDYHEAVSLLKEYTYPVVIKADGLAFGKGVVIAEDEKMAISTLEEMLITNTDIAYQEVVIEEFLDGFECSLLCFVDGKLMKPMVSVKDHKQIYEGNTGPNTGGMGTVSPNPFLKQEDEALFNEDIIEPIMKGLLAENIDYRGVLFIGLMIKDGKAKVLEFNVRFGDPETQAIMLRLDSDLLDIMLACINQDLDNTEIKWNDKHVACLVLASLGYPNAYEKNYVIEGLNNNIDSKIFHAGTYEKDGLIYTNGGRVLNICNSGNTLQEALSKVYADAEKITYTKKTYRKDIGLI